MKYLMIVLFLIGCSQPIEEEKIKTIIINDSDQNYHSEHNTSNGCRPPLVLTFIENELEVTKIFVFPCGGKVLNPSKLSDQPGWQEEKVNDINIMDFKKPSNPDPLPWDLTAR